MDLGMITLRRAGLMNALRGVTSVEEVMRHTVGEDVVPDEAPSKPKAETEAAPEAAVPEAAAK